MERPPLGSILNAVVMPAAGGDTMWTNQQAAYEALSASMQDVPRHVDRAGTAARSSSAGSSRSVKDDAEWDGKPTDLGPTEHPVIRTHPETGVRTIFVNPGFTQRIVQLTRSESDALLAFLYADSTRPEFVVRHHWHEGDLAFWDNRARRSTRSWATTDARRA